MPDHLHKYLVCIFAIFICTFAYSQKHSFKNVTTESGLASSECYKIIQDRQGYMWISTDAGLCKYNGKEFKTFTTNNGLPSNTIFEIMEDKYGRIWGGCFPGDIFYIYNDSVYTIAANTELKQHIAKSQENIKKIVLDEKQVLHVGTTANYYRIFPQENYKKIITSSKPDTSYVNLHRINNELLFARLLNAPTVNKFVINYTGKEIIFRRKPDKTHKLASTFSGVLTKNGGIFFNYYNDLYYYHPLESPKFSKQSFPNNIISLFIDNSNNLWIGLYNIGYVFYPGGNCSKVPITGLEGKSISSFCQDKEGGIWITTTNNGIFYSQNTNILYPDSLGDQSVAGLKRVGKNLFCATSNNLIYTIQNNVTRFILGKEFKIPGSLNYFNVIGNKMFYSGGYTCEFDSSGHYEFTRNINGKKPMQSVQIFSVNDITWGINITYLFTIKNNTVNKNIPLPSRGFCAYYSSRSELLVGCMDGLYEYKNEQFYKINISHKPPRISFITEDRNKCLWITTKDQGVFVRKNNEWINIDQKKGLISDICNHILPVSNGDYYISTNKGLSIIKSAYKYYILNIDHTNGLSSSEINITEEFEGKIYVATRKGLCYFDINSNIFNYSLPPATLKQATLGNEKLENEKIYSYSSNDLFFQCDILSYQSPGKNLLKYQLLPIDSTARYSEPMVINYDNLSPGKYTLKVQAINNNGIEGSPILYKFTIRPPFWTTWWFIVLCMIMFGSGLYIFIRQRIIYLSKREEEKNILKEKIIEYHYTALRAQMNPHFIFNVINSIQLYVLKNQPKEAYNYLSKFSRLIRRVLQNSKEKLISLSDEMETIKIYMELEQIRLEGNIEFYAKVEDSLDLENTLVPSMIIQPLLENAIWHGIVPLKENRIGKISLDISLYDQMVRIRIRDNGKGIDKNTFHDKKESYGLSLIKDRLALLSNNTRFEVANLTDINGMIKGLEVTILIPFMKK